MLRTVLPALGLLVSVPALASDWSLDSFTVPSSVGPGDTFTISAAVTNNGPDPDQAFLAVRWSTDATYDYGVDELICYLPSLADNYVLNANQSDSSTVSCTMPTGAGAATHIVARLITIGDDPDYTDNVASRALGAAPTPEPDLVAELVAPSSAQRGDSLSLDWTVRNEGTGAAGASTLRIDFVDNGGARSSSVCGPASVPTVAVGATRTGQVSGCTIPANAALGAGRFEAIADAGTVVSESNESNNTGTAAVTIVATPPTPKPDLVVASAAPPVQVAPGDAFTLTAGLRNTGSANASNVTTVVRWSTSDTPGSGTASIGQDSGRILSSGSPTASVAIGCTAPTSAASGTAWLHVTIDDPDTVSESDETNNTRIVPITVIAAERPVDTGVLDTFDTANPADSGEDKAPEDGPPDDVDTDLNTTPPLQTLGCACDQRAPTPAGLVALGVGLLTLRRRRR